MPTSNKNRKQSKNANTGNKAAEPDLPDLSKLDPSKMSAEQLAKLTADLQAAQSRVADAAKEAKAQALKDVKAAVEQITPPEECTFKIAFRATEDGTFERDVTVTYGRPRKRSNGGQSSDPNRYHVRKHAEKDGEVTADLGIHPSQSTAGKVATERATCDGGTFWRTKDREVAVGDVIWREYKGGWYSMTVLAPEGAQSSGEAGGEPAAESSGAQSEAAE